MAAAGAAAARPVRAQTIPAGLAADTLVLRADSVPARRTWSRPLEAGDRVVAWVEGRVRAGRPDAGGRPVPDAPAGAVVARFGSSAAFAWPVGRTVWAAPAAGRLAFGLNGRPAHELEGTARVILVPLGAEGSAAQSAFERPILALDRVEGGVRARYADRAGFGLVPRSLSLTLTTSHGTVYYLGPWVPPGARETTLPLPPPGIDLPPGVHTLTATITDRLGNVSPPASLRFDTGP